MDPEDLTFTSIVLNNIISMEPSEFHPDIHEYQVMRTKDKPMVEFHAILSAEPCTRTESNSWNFRPYENYDLDYTYSSYNGRGIKWFPSDPSNKPIYFPVDIPYRVSQLTVCMIPTKHKPDVLKSKVYKFIFNELELSLEERSTCTHPSTYREEGECWGGASGSSQVEFLNICKVCSLTVGRQFEYYN